MSLKSKFSLTYGIVNILLPIVFALIRQGEFRNLTDNNAWEYFYIILIFRFLPFISSIFGIIIANIWLKKSTEKAIKIGLYLSVIGLIIQVVFHFVLNI